MIGQSPPMLELRARITRLAGTQFTVLIEGESGAGKELVAREVHQLSPRRAGPFVAVNCAALVDSLLEAELFGIEERTATGVRGRRGKFELADHGTLFLDEVADLSASAQAKLLRVLQDFSVERVGGHASHRVDTRIVAATNRSLRSLVDAGQFRADLYYRISGVELIVPPLRERRQDVPLLVDYFAGRHRRLRQLPVEQTTMGALVAYDWPGNIRQLARVLERALALSPGPSISLSDLPADITRQFREAGGGDLASDRTLRGCIGRYARLILDQCQGNKRRACEILDISYHTLQTYLDYERDREPGPRRLTQETTAGIFCERTG
ncbi:MAG TPA: sigma 54-interacting transcriptional regulator [Vicinamibacterales bacterium]|nr:sigma 54-interacting transcriptional regulator [Vicinamibacterales bacterium]